MLVLIVLFLALFFSVTVLFSIMVGMLPSHKNEWKERFIIGIIFCFLWVWFYYLTH